MLDSMSNQERGREQTRRQPEDDFTIYNRVRVLRQDRGLSQKELAKVLGLNHRTVGYLERQDYEPSHRLVLKISDFFGVPPEAVFSREPFKPFSEYLQSAEHNSGERKQDTR